MENKPLEIPFLFLHFLLIIMVTRAFVAWCFVVALALAIFQVERFLTCMSVCVSSIVFFSGLPMKQVVKSSLH